jgi:hypothetical protein
VSGQRTRGDSAEALHPLSWRTPLGAAMYQQRTKGLYSGEGAVNVM